MAGLIGINNLPKMPWVWELRAAVLFFIKAGDVVAKQSPDPPASLFTSQRVPQTFRMRWDTGGGGGGA